MEPCQDQARQNAGSTADQTSSRKALRAIFRCQSQVVSEYASKLHAEGVWKHYSKFFLFGPKSSRDSGLLVLLCPMGAQPSMPPLSLSHSQILKIEGHEENPNDSKTYLQMSEDRKPSISRIVRISISLLLILKIEPLCAPVSVQGC